MWIVLLRRKIFSQSAERDVVQDTYYVFPTKERAERAYLNLYDQHPLDTVKIFKEVPYGG